LSAVIGIFVRIDVQIVGNAVFEVIYMSIKQCW
jgi:hypothetical protein